MMLVDDTEKIFVGGKGLNFEYWFVENLKNRHILI